MTLQIRPRATGDATIRWYDPNRDIVYLLRNMTRAVLETMTTSDPATQDYLQHGGSRKDLEVLGNCMATFIGTAFQEADPRQCFLKSGLGDCEAKAVDLLARKMLIAILSAFHKGMTDMQENPHAAPALDEEFIAPIRLLVSQWEELQASWPRRVLLRICRWLGRSRINPITEERKNDAWK